MITVKTSKGNPATLEYTNDLPIFRDAVTVGNHVKILPACEDNWGLLVHELTHVDQWYEHKFYSARYKYFSDFRKRMETEAYAAQVKADDSMDNINEYSLLLSQNYNLGISQKEAAIEIINAVKGIG